MKKIVIVFSIIIILFVCITFTIFITNKSSTIKILTTPTYSNITINGKPIKDGTSSISPGTYIVSVSYPGFRTQSKRIIINNKHSVFVGVSLIPNSSKTSSFYSNNQYQEKIAESISSNNNITGSKLIIKNEPIIKFLPYIGPSAEYEINYKTNNSNPGNPYIVISSATPIGKQDAMKWIRSKGFDPTYINIIFNNNSPVLN